MIALAFENTKQPRCSLAPQIVQCTAVIFEPVGETGINQRRTLDELAATQLEYPHQRLKVVGTAEPVELGNIGHNGRYIA